MSRETSKSPSTVDREVRIQISLADETTSTPTSLPTDDAPSPHKLSFSAPLTATIIPIEDVEERTTEKEDRKKTRKSIDDQKGRRKDTATSISNFLHRFTRSDKEEKHKSVISEEEKLIDRPDKLTLPDSGEDNWLELKTLGTDQFRTALDMGNEAGLPIYEWKIDSLEEILVSEGSHKELIRMEHDDPNLDVMEQSLAVMLDDFRSGNMRSFSNDQLNAMQAAKQEHEDVTNLHLALYPVDDHHVPQSEAQLDVMYDQLSEKLYKMHARLGDIASIPIDNV